jgi:hypothetical protein
MTTFFCLIFETPSNLEGQVSVFIFPQEQRGPVIPPGTGFLFRRLLCLARLGWRYSKPPPRGQSDTESTNDEFVGNIVRRIDPLLDKDLEMNNETTAVDIQRHGKYASTTIRLLLKTVLSTRRENEEFSILKAVARGRLVKTQQTGKGSAVEISDNVVKCL